MLISQAARQPGANDATMIQTKAPRTCESLLRDLQARDIHLWVADGELKYRAPPGRLTADLAAEIRSSKSEIIALLAHRPAAPTATVRGEVSGLQRHMLAYYEHLQFPRFLHLCKVVAFDRALNLDLLRRSVHHMVQRHAILRTRFAPEDNGWSASIDPQIQLEIEDVDLTAIVPSGEQAQAAKEWFEQISARRFDVSNGPLLRVAVLRLAGEHWLLALIFHHAVSDGWSLALAVRELTIAYSCLERQRPIVLPALSGQVHEVLARQRQWLESPAGQRQIRFWKDLFADVRQPFRLPTEPRTATANRREPVEHEIGTQRTEALRMWARQEQTTLFIIVLAAFCVALTRWRGDPEVCLWSLHHGRSRPELYDLIGCFFDTLGLRINLSGATDFRAAARAVHEHYLQTFPNREVPSQTVAGIIFDVVGPLERATLFNYVAHTTGGGANSPPPAGAPRGETAALAHALEQLAPNGYLETENGTQLIITAFERNDGLRWMIQYDPHEFQDSTMETLSASTLRLLERVADGAEVPLNPASA